MQISPWIYLQADRFADDTTSRDYFKRETLMHFAEAYIKGDQKLSSKASPLLVDFKNLVPLFVSYGGKEILRNQAIELIKRARDAGVDVTEVVDPRLYHDYLCTGTMIGEASWRDIRKLADWMNKQYQAAA